MTETAPQLVSQPEKNTVDTEAFWHDLEKVVIRDIDRIFQVDFQALRKRGTSETELENLRNTFVTQERTFAVGVCEQIDSALREHPEKKVLSLFDIDGTILLQEWVGEETHSVFRPSLLPVLERVKNAGAEIGLLSTRGDTYMMAQLEDESELLPLRAYINPKHVYSANPEEYSPQDDEADARVEKIAETDPSDKWPEFTELKQNSSPLQLAAGVGDLEDSRTLEFLASLQKLRLLRRCKGDYPNFSVVVVDDLKYAGLLNREQGFYGLAIDSFSRSAMFERY